MQSLTGKVTGNSLTAAEWNQLPAEVQNVITDLGITLSSGDLNQLGKAIAGYVANGSFYTDSGTANAKVLTAVGAKQSPTAYTDGMAATFIIGATNTAATTVNVAGLGVKNIADTSGGELIIGATATLRYRTSSGDFNIEYVTSATAAIFNQGHLFGLELSNNATDANRDIDIAAGTARNSGNTFNMTLSSALGKQLDVTWAAGGTPGTTLGGLFTGSIAATTWYHVFLIRKDSDGSIDAGFDTSVTAANIPAGYTAYRRLGSVLTDGSSNIIAFTQVYDKFYWSDPPLDMNATPSSSGANITLTAPIDIKVLSFVNVSHAGGELIYLSSPDVNNEAPSTTTAPLSTLYDIVDDNAGQAEIMTNTSAQIRQRASAASGTTRIATLGWQDPLGRFN